MRDLSCCFLREHAQALRPSLLVPHVSQASQRPALHARRVAGYFRWAEPERQVGVPLQDLPETLTGPRPSRATSNLWVSQPSWHRLRRRRGQGPALSLAALGFLASRSCGTVRAPQEQRVSFVGEERLCASPRAGIARGSGRVPRYPLCPVAACRCAVSRPCRFSSACLPKRSPRLDFKESILPKSLAVPASYSLQVRPSASTMRSQTCAARKRRSRANCVLHR